MQSGVKRQKTARPAAVRWASFPPVADQRARVLILGTLPGVASLCAGQYYAHPRNQFWRLMDALCGAGPSLPYARRLARLRAARIALWDVVADAEREGSGDAAIRSPRPNDIPALLQRCPRIHTIFFNGQPAARLFRRLLERSVRSIRPDLRCVTLPSSSPAHAARTFEDKLRCWRVAFEEAGA